MEGRVCVEADTVSPARGENLQDGFICSWPNQTDVANEFTRGPPAAGLGHADRASAAGRLPVLGLARQPALRGRRAARARCPGAADLALWCRAAGHAGVPALPDRRPLRLGSFDQTPAGAAAGGGGQRHPLHAGLWRGAGPQHDPQCAAHRCGRIARADVPAPGHPLAAVCRAADAAAVARAPAEPAPLQGPGVAPGQPAAGAGGAGGRADGGVPADVRADAQPEGTALPHHSGQCAVVSRRGGGCQHPRRRQTAPGHRRRRPGRPAPDRTHAPAGGGAGGRRNRTRRQLGPQWLRTPDHAATGAAAGGELCRSDELRHQHRGLAALHVRARGPARL